MYIIDHSVQLPSSGAGKYQSTVQLVSKIWISGFLSNAALQSFPDTKSKMATLKIQDLFQFLPRFPTYHVFDWDKIPLKN